jgi:hypothetical protein
MRDTSLTTPPANRAASADRDHPIAVIKNAFAALEGLDSERPELVPESRRALGGLHDMAWFARSRIFDGYDRSPLRRTLERVSIAAAIVSTRRADASPAGARRLRQAIGMLCTTLDEGTAMLSRAAVEAGEDRATRHAPRPRQAVEEPFDAAEVLVDRAA